MRRSSGFAMRWTADRSLNTMRSMRIRGIVGLCAVGLVVTFALGAVPADAKKKKAKVPPVVTATATASTSTDGQLVSPTAVCPKGTVALGGGYSGGTSEEGGMVTDLYVVYESRRASESSWQVGAAREDSGASGNPVDLTATVFCQSPKLGKAKKASVAKKRKKMLAVSEVSATGPGAANAAQSSATVTCPAGTLISGGFRVSPPATTSSPLAFPVVYANYASSPTAWTASETTSGPTALAITSYADCAKTKAPLSATGSGGVSPGATGSATSSSCPKGHPLFGGGFNNTTPAASGPVETPYESTGAAGGWRVSAYNIAGVSASLQAIAYCR